MSHRFTRSLALAALFGASCGPGEAPFPDAAAGDAPVREDAGRELPLGEGRPSVDGITRATLRDDETLTVTRVHFAPGAAEPLHTHAFELVVVPLVAGTVEWIVDGETTASLGPGEVQFVARDVPHQLINAGDEPFEVIAIAVK